jgi:hypothetical protein
MIELLVAQGADASAKNTGEWSTYRRPLAWPRTRPCAWRSWPQFGERRSEARKAPDSADWGASRALGTHSFTLRPFRRVVILNGGWVFAALLTLYSRRLFSRYVIDRQRGQRTQTWSVRKRDLDMSSLEEYSPVAAVAVDCRHFSERRRTQRWRSATTTSSSRRR